MADDFKERFKQAGLILGDGINQAFGGKQNIYGTYTAQKEKRFEAEQKRLEMERRANAEAAKALLTAQYRDNKLAQGQDSARRTEATSLANTRSLRPIMPSDINRQPIGPNMTPEQAMARTAARQQNRSLSDSSVPGALIGGERTNYMLDTSPASKFAQEARRTESMGINKSNLAIKRYDEAGASFNSNDTESLKQLETAYARPVDTMLKSGRVYETTAPDGTKEYNVRTAEEYKNFKQSFSEKEREGFAGRYDTLNSIGEVRKVFGELGDIPASEWKKLEIDSQKVDNKKLNSIGVFSLPANIRIARQFEATADPRLSRAITALQSAIQAYRKNISGTAVSEYEIKDLMQVFPQLKDNPKVFMEKLKAIEDKGATELGTRLDTLEASGKDARGFRKQYDSYVSSKDRGYKKIDGQGVQAPKLNKTQQSLYDRYK